MARTGGRTPYDKGNALTGPARVLWAPTTVAIPTVPSDVVQQVADASGEYPAKTGWNDFGLAADAPSYSHNKDTEGLEYEQPGGVLFDEVSSIERSFTAQVGEIEPETIKIIENSSISEAVAASAASAAAGVKSSAWTKIHAGLYSSFIPYRIALISYRPTGAGVVTEPGPPVVTRPPAVMRVIPLCALAADEIEVGFERGEPTNAEVAFAAQPDTTLAAGKQHGWWAVETPGAIVA